jgi:hypothetical protein
VASDAIACRRRRRRHPTTASRSSSSCSTRRSTQHGAGIGSRGQRTGRAGRQFCAWAAVTIRVPRRAQRANTSQMSHDQEESLRGADAHARIEFEWSIAS